MNYEKIIEQKINFLNGDSPDDLTAEMLEQIDNDPLLQKELSFIEDFWKPTTQDEEQLPSSALSKNFYQMIDQAKKSQQSVLEAKQRKESTLFQILENLFQPKYVLQLATVMMVFTFGYYINQPQNEGQNRAMASLQKEVKSLSSMVALSMIQKSLASERLSGVAYSKQSTDRDGAVSSALIELLNSDSSTAVRLAVIDAFSARGSAVILQRQLVESIAHQKNALVQLELVSLILKTGNENSKQDIMDMNKDGLLINEVSAYLEQVEQRVTI